MLEKVLPRRTLRAQRWREILNPKLETLNKFEYQNTKDLNFP